MAKRLNYEIGFSANTKELKSAVNDAITSLQKLGTTAGLGASKNIKEASNAALELSYNLKSAINQDTGRLDLTLFNRNLKDSGKTLNDYATQLSKLGPEGNQAFLGVANAISKAELPLIRTNKLMTELWTTMKNTARWQLTSSVLHGFMGALQTSFGYAKDLNESLTNIRIVSGQSAEQMSKFAIQANKAAEALSATTTDYTDAALIYFQQGLEGDAVTERTDATIKMANVTGQTAQEVSDQLTAVWNNFDDGTKSLEYYADVLTALGAATASSSEEISEGLEKFASIAGTVGLSYEYSTAALATVTATTRQSAEVVGTAFKTLFARIQGLQLGETQEDGTDLNKYSTALARVGIEIKDTSGELKDMDDILDELGETWGTLSKDQQVALAQTVAGVRQWNQMVALMDNWDFFKENLAVAENSSGTLNEQAEIYAESWEAASKRVRAAAEDIYDSLIDDEFFIGALNGVEKLLNGISNLIDGLGGMKGVALLVSSVLMKAFSGKISDSLKDTVSSIANLTGLTKNNLTKTLEETRKQVDNFNGKTNDNSLKIRNSMLSQELALKAEINRRSSELTQAEMEYISKKEYELTLLKEQTEEHLKQVDLLKQQTELDRSELFNDYYDNIDIENIQDKSRLQTIGIKTEFKEGNEEDLFNEVFSKYEQTLKKGANIPLNFEVNDDNLDYWKQVLQKSDIEVPIDISTEEMTNQLNEVKTNFSKERKNIEEVLKVDFGLSDKAVNNYRVHLTTLEQQLFKGEITQEEFNSKVKQLGTELDTHTIPSVRSWADHLMNVSNALLLIIQLQSSLENIGTIFSDEDLSFGEKISQAIPNLSQLIILFSMFTKQALPKLKRSAADGVKAIGMLGTSIKGTTVASGLLQKGLFRIVNIGVKAVPYLGTIITLGSIAIKIIDKLVVTNKEAIEALDSFNEEISTEQSEIDSLNNELETTESRIKELQSQDSLTLVEQEELKKLERSKELLEKEIELREEALKLQLKEQFEENKKNGVYSEKALNEKYKVKDYDSYYNLLLPKDVKQELKGLSLEDSYQAQKDYINTTYDYDDEQLKFHLDNLEEWYDKQQAILIENGKTYLKAEQDYNDFVDNMIFANGKIDTSSEAWQNFQNTMEQAGKASFESYDEYYADLFSRIEDENIWEVIKNNLNPDDIIDSSEYGSIEQALALLGIDEALINEALEYLQSIIADKNIEGLNFSLLTPEQLQFLLQADDIVLSNIKNIEDLNYQMERAKEIENPFDFASSFSTLAEELEISEEALEVFYNQLKDSDEYTNKTEEELLELTETLYKQQKAAETLSKVWNDNEEAIQNWVNGLDDSLETQNKVAELQKAFNDFFDSDISSDFIKEHFDTINKAINGSKEALEELYILTSEDRIRELQIEFNLSKSGEVFSDILFNELSILQNQLPDLEIGAKVDISPETYTRLNELIQKTGMTSEQVQKNFAAMGFNAKIKTKYIYTNLFTGSSFTTDKNRDKLFSSRAWSKVEIPVVEYITKGESFGGNIELNGIGGGGGGRGGGGSSYTAPEPKTVSNDDRYHEVDKQLEFQSDLISDIDTQIDRTYGTNKVGLFANKINSLNHQLELQNQKLAAAENYLAMDLQAIHAQGLIPVIDQITGQVLNYSQLVQQAINDFNAVVTKSRVTEAQVNAAEKLYNARMEALKQYEETLNILDEIERAREDTLRAIEDEKLNEIIAKYEVVFDLAKAEEEVRDFAKSIAEVIGDELDHGLESLKIDAESAQAQMDLYDTYSNKLDNLSQRMKEANEYTDTAAIRDEIANLRSEIIASGEDLIDFINTLEEAFPNALDAARERLELFTGMIEHNKKVLESYTEIITLQGVNEGLMERYELIAAANKNQLEASRANLALQSKHFAELEESLRKAQESLERATEGTVEYDILKANRDALLEEYQETQTAMLDSAKETMEAAREIFTAAIEQISKELENFISKDKGFDFMETEFDHFIEEEERYLDEVNRVYEMTKLQNKLNNAMNDASSDYAKSQLAALREEFELRAENNKLSEYDIQIMNAKYEATLKQIALEEAQQAKTQVRLVRDSQGNWSYQYTSDQDAIQKAQDELNDAQNDWYNIAKDQATDIAQEIINTWREMTEKIAEIYTDEELTQEQRDMQILELRQFYGQKILDLESEKQKALADMEAAGSAAVQDFSNDYGEALDQMTEFTDDFEGNFDEAINKMEEAMEEYRNTIEEVCEESGLSYEELAEKIAEVGEITDETREAGEDAVKQMWDALDAIHDQIEVYADWADAIYEVVKAMEELADASVKTEASGSSSNTSASNIAADDYSRLMAKEYSDAGGEYTDRYYELEAKRQAKLDSLSEEERNKYLSNNELKKEIKKRYENDTLDEVISGAEYFGTGGYTGTFDDAKLAFVHQKELILNPEDTKNILASVNFVRKLEPELLSFIAQQLDTQAKASKTLMGERWGAPRRDHIDKNQEIKQHIEVTAEFPNAVDQNEIKEAILGLANYATQYIYRS